MCSASLRQLRTSNLCPHPANTGRFEWNWQAVQFIGEGLGWKFPVWIAYCQFWPVARPHAFFATLFLRRAKSPMAPNPSSDSVVGSGVAARSMIAGWSVAPVPSP